MTHSLCKWQKNVQSIIKFTCKTIQSNFLYLFNSPFQPILIDIKKIDTLALKKDKTENNKFVQAVSNRE
jgi:hypothetical protein